MDLTLLGIGVPLLEAASPICNDSFVWDDELVFPESKWESQDILDTSLLRSSKGVDSDAPCDGGLREMRSCTPSEVSFSSTPTQGIGAVAFSAEDFFNSFYDDGYTSGPLTPESFREDNELEDRTSPIPSETDIDLSSPITLEEVQSLLTSDEITISRDARVDDTDTGPGSLQPQVLATSDVDPAHTIDIAKIAALLTGLESNALDAVSATCASAVAKDSTEDAEAGKEEDDEVCGLTTDSGSSVEDAEEPAATGKRRYRRKGSRGAAASASWRTCGVDKAARKKQQNKDAATRYRLKRKAEMDEFASDYDGAIALNASLKKRVCDMEQEVHYLKTMLLGIVGNSLSP